MVPTRAQIRLDGPGLRALLKAGLSALQPNVPAVNALNVFPVPDGDTGTNLLLTLQAVQEATEGQETPSVGKTAEAMAHAALLAARGNSGVILALFLRGLASALQGQDSATPEDLARGFEEGAQRAYRAVSRPVEGTMLTVMRASAEGARRGAPGGLRATLESALRYARSALERTPDLLPILREAGVVDAGGQGFVLLLEGMVRALQGEDPAGVRLPTPPAGTPAVRHDFLEATRGQRFGYCVQFLLESARVDAHTLRDALAPVGDSTIVVEEGPALVVHTHTADPEALLRQVGQWGQVSRVQVQDIDRQHTAFLSAQGKGAPTAVAVVAVAWGPGLEELFRSLGAVVVPGGPTRNPSTQDLLTAVESTPAERVVLLPNHPHILPVAEQVKALASKEVRVVPSRSIPQGVSALLAFSPEEPLEEVLPAMEQALQGVRSGEVTRAVRDADLPGLRVRAGQALALLDGEPAGVADTPEEAVLLLLERVRPQEGTVVTLYWGEGATEARARDLIPRIRERFPGVGVEVLHGGQPHYPYLVAVEA